MAQQRVSKRTRSAPTRLVAAEEEAPAAKKPRAPKAAPTSLKAKQATTKNPTKAKAKRATKKTTATNPLLSTLATATSSACQRRSGSHAPSRATGACTGARRLASVAAKPLLRRLPHRRLGRRRRPRRDLPPSGSPPRSGRLPQHLCRPIAPWPRTRPTPPPPPTPPRTPTPPPPTRTTAAVATRRRRR